LIVQEIIALCMFVNGSLDGHMLVEGNNISKCLEIKREARKKFSRKSFQ